jgi:type IV secretion system protein VirB10
MQQEMTSALAAQLGQATLQLLQKNLNIKPTLKIRPGYQFNVIVTKDLVFQEPYAAGK